MLRRVRNVVIAAILIFMSASIIFGVALYTVDPTRYKDVLVKQFNESTGMQLDVKGEVKFIFHPLPAISLRQIVLHSKTPWYTYELQADSLILHGTWETISRRELSAYPFLLEKGKIKFKSTKGDYKSFALDSVEGVLDLRKKMALTGVKYTDQGADTSANINFSLDKKARLTGDLRLKQLQLNEKGQLLSKQPFLLDGLDRLDVNLDVHIDDLVIHKKHLFDTQFHLDIKNNTIFVNKLSSKFANGMLSGEFSLVNQKTPSVKLFLKGQHVLLGQLFNIPPRTFSGGRLFVELDGQGSGNSIYHISQNFSGNLLIQMGKSVIHDHNIRTSEGFFLSIFSFLSGNDKNYRTAVECMVGKAKINKGTAYFNPGVGIETNEAVILGGGHIHIPSQRIHFEVGLDHKTPISLQMGAFDNTMTIDGTLQNPRFSISNAAVIQEGGSVLLAIATGGVSLIAQKALQEVQKITDPCGRVLRAEPKIPSSKSRKAQH